MLDHSFGTWIRRRRKALDLTQHQLAARVGCSVSLIFKIESDERRPSRQIAELLATHLEIPEDQRSLFMKVARQEKSIDALSSSTSPPATQTPPLSVQRKSNLPAPLTSLIGREHERHAILQQLQNPLCRLLTLMGPGGVGKTRLALEVGQHLQDTFRDGVYFVSLVGTSACEFTVPAIADALGVPLSGAAELKTQLFQYLKARQMLLILDNLEHLLDGIELLDELLQYAPEIKLLTTSREQLNLRAEWVFEVQGLPIPATIQLDALDQSSAVALLLERVRQTKVNLTVTTEDLPAIMRICQLVEGSPLGLELAATWFRLMSFQDVAREIEKNVDFLTATARDIPARHRSMRAVFDYSWSLLSDTERQIMQRLSVFRGGFTRPAAERVAGASLFQLSALVNKSLLRHLDGSSTRYDIHELIRQYALITLQEDAQAYADTLSRHADYFAAWLRQQEAHLQGPGLPEALTQIVQEIDNLRLAWDWMVTHRQVANLRNSLVSLFVLHDIRNWIRQGAALFEKAVTALQSEGHDNIALGELMTCQGHMSWHVGEIQKARELFERSLKILGSHRDCAMLAELLLYLSVLEHSLGNYPSARKLAEECVALNREQGRASGTGYALSLLGLVCLAQGEYEAAYGYLKEGVLVMRSLAFSRGIAITLSRLGAVALHLGKLDEAQQLLEESLVITRQFNDRWGIGNALNYLGLLAAAKKDYQSAESMLRESIALFEEDGDQILQASTLSDLGHVLLERHADQDAWNTLQRALQIAMRIQILPVVLHALVAIAVLRARQGSIQPAFELVMHSWSHPSSSYQTRDLAAKLCKQLEPKLSPQQVEAARSKAQSLTTKDISQILMLPAVSR